MSNKALRAQLPGLTSSQATRILARLRAHGVIKKAARCYRYYLTALGRKAIVLGLRLKNLEIVPQLAFGDAP